MQTELTTKAAEKGKSINLKKGQFLSPNDVEKIVLKIKSTGNNNITITERGTCFGYRDLMVDPRSFLILKKLNYPVFFDVGHSVRRIDFHHQILKMEVKKNLVKLMQDLQFQILLMDYLLRFIQIQNAKCDVATQFSFSEFENLMNNVKPLWDFVNSDKI